MTRAAVAGRERELESMRGLIYRTGEGRGGALWLTGEPGIGKSTLLDAFGRECEQAGVRVLRGAAEQMETGLPFAALGSCLGVDSPDPSDDAARIARALRGGGAAADVAAPREFAVTELVLELVEQWCAAGPVALLLDDAQWADRPSLLALHRLGLVIGHLPLVLGLTTRPVPHNEDLAQLLRSLKARGGTPLHLGPLPDADVAELVNGLIGAPPDSDVVRLVSGAAGNPLYVTELVDALRREGRILVDGGGAHTGPLPDVPTTQNAPNSSSTQNAPNTPDADPNRLPGSLAEAILRRLDFLPRRARGVLQFAAALGAGLNVAEFAVILGCPTAGLYEVIEDAVRAGLLADSDGELAFRHDLIRQALSESLPATVRDGLQAQAAHALADSGAPVERVVRYLSNDAALDSRMLDWLVGSADALVVRAPQAAVELLERSLARIEPGDGRAAPLRLQLVRALLWSGAPDRAEEAARVALADGPDHVVEVALRSMLVHACFQQGRIGRAIAECREAAQSAELTEVEAARFEFLAAQCRFTRGDLDPGEETHAYRMMAIDDGEIRAYGLSYLACVRHMQGRFAEALEAADRAAAAIADRASLPEWKSGNALNRAFCLVELDRLPEAAEAFETGTRQAEQHGSAYWSWFLLGTAGVHLLAGRWDDSLAEIKAGLETIDLLGHTRGLNSEWGLRSQMALIAAHRGDFDTCVELLGSSDSVRPDAFYGYVRLWSEALVHEAQGRPADALELLVDAWVKADGLRRHRGLHYVCPDLARLAVSLGDMRQARKLAEEVARLGGPRPDLSLRATAALCAALVDDDAELMIEAKRDFATAGRPLYQAYAAEHAAVLLARTGRVEQARAELAAAAALYDGLEARADLARAEERLRREGVRRSGQSARRRPKTGWEALTETERKIAALVAEGNSNPGIAARMFISRRTVQSHVSSILTKLDLTSRVELAVLAHQRNQD